MSKNEKDEVEETEDEVVEDDVSDDKVEDDRSEEETTDWEEKFKKEEGRRKRAETKLSKSKTSDKPKPPKSENKDGFDYGQKAFLIASGIKGSKEEEFVQEELEKAGGELDELFKNEYFKNRLEEFREINKTSDAVPKETRSGKSVDSIDYWMTQPMEKVPKDLRAKVVNAKLKKDENKGQFYNSD